MDYILWQHSNVEDEEEQDAVSICVRPMKQKRLGMSPWVQNRTDSRRL